MTPKVVGFFYCFVLLNSCQTTEKKDQNPQILDEMTFQSDLPVKIKSPDFKKETHFKISNRLLDISLVKKSQTAIREGPGTQFPILPDILISKTSVIRFNHFNSWVKIYIPTLQKKAWIHKHALGGNDKQGTSNLTIKDLPRVFATKNIDFAYTYSKRKKSPVRITKGSSFPWLRQVKGYFLVLAGPSYSLFWLKRGDVH